MAGSGIPAKGVGAPPFDSETGKAANEKSGFLRAKMAAWRAAHPDAPPTMRERDQIHREALRERMPEILDAAIEVATDKNHPDFKILAPMLIKQDMGNPRQGVEVSGPDGEAIEVRDVSDRIARRLAGLAAARDTSGDTL